VIGVGYGPEDEVDLIHKVGPAECQMEARAGVDDHGPIASWCPVPAWRVPASWRAISQTHNTKQPFAASNFLVFRNGIFHAKPLAGDPALASELPESSS
jgi:hypothetical protein